MDLSTWNEREPTHYRCQKCSEVFEIPEAVVEVWWDKSEHFGQAAFDTKEVPHCPYCFADDLADDTNIEDDEQIQEIVK